MVGPTSASSSSSKGGWRAAIFIIFVEMAERFAYYGVAGNLITYLTSVLGQTTATAARNVNIWQGVSAVFPIFGAFLADSYVGRFKTILISSVIYLLGLVFLTIIASGSSSRHHHGSLFFIALYIISIGEGGHKPCVQTFAADQFDEKLPHEKEAKSSFFNWWYLGIVIGATSAILVAIYVQDYVGWGPGFGMLAGVDALALVLFLIGIKTYRRQAPVGSPFTRIAQVLVAAARKRGLSERHDARGICYDDGKIDVVGGSRICTLARTTQFRFLDKAMMIDDIDTSCDKRNPWRLCSLNQVEEVKQLLRLVPIWLCCLTYAVVIAQLSTYFTKQGSTMKRFIGPKFQIPAASVQVITGLTILMAVPLYDRFIVPFARKFTGHTSGITMLQRIGFGLFLSMIMMIVAALVEVKRQSIAREHGLLNMPKSVVPMAIWWLIPQYMLCALADVFTIVGLQELFYDQIPEEMRSMGAAAHISVIGVGSFLSSAIISIVQKIESSSGNKWLVDNLNRAHLDYFYWLLAVLSALNLCAYVFVAKCFVYKRLESADLNIDQEIQPDLNLLNKGKV